jgi:hypothetical protein
MQIGSPRFKTRNGSLPQIVCIPTENTSKAMTFSAKRLLRMLRTTSWCCRPTNETISEIELARLTLRNAALTLRDLLVNMKDEGFERIGTQQQCFQNKIVQFNEVAKERGLISVLPVVTYILLASLWIVPFWSSSKILPESSTVSYISEDTFSTLQRIFHVISRLSGGDRVIHVPFFCGVKI